ncbi:hypothetical protein ACI65C_004355, partial [Semiaphis heraclei]
MVKIPANSKKPSLIFFFMFSPPGLDDKVPLILDLCHFWFYRIRLLANKMSAKGEHEKKVENTVKLEIKEENNNEVETCRVTSDYYELCLIISPAPNTFIVPRRCHRLLYNYCNNFAGYTKKKLKNRKINFHFSFRGGGGGQLASLANILVGCVVKGESVCCDGGGGECQVFALTDDAPVEDFPHAVTSHAVFFHTRNPKWGLVPKMSGVDPSSSTACFCPILSY